MATESQTQHPLSEVRSVRDLLPKGRLEAFADGVLAIVITILVLELKVPGRGEGGHLAHALGQEWRVFAGYLISFVFVGGVWIAHANATRLVKRGDQILFRLSLLPLPKDLRASTRPCGWSSAARNAASGRAR